MGLSERQGCASYTAGMELLSVTVYSGIMSCDHSYLGVERDLAVG